MTLHTIKMSFAALMAAVALSACSNAATDEPTLDDEGDGWHTCTLRFDSAKPEFDLNGRASEGSWSTGNRVFINFTLANGSTTYGNALYKSDGTWELNYNGRLSTGSMYSCEVYYFDGSYNANELMTRFTLTAYNGVYADRQAIYTYSNGELTLSATLAPITSRIRFTSDATLNSYRLRGIEYISGFDLETNTFTTVNTNTDNPLSLYYGSTYNDVYLYGTYPTDASLRLQIGNYIYTFDMPEDMTGFMQIGKSGYMTIPTPSAHNGWMVESYNPTSGSSYEIGTYTSPGIGSGTYSKVFTIAEGQRLKVSFSNIEQYASKLSVRVYETTNYTDITTITRTQRDLDSFDEYVELATGEYGVSVTTSARRCTFTFYVETMASDF